MHGLKYPGVLPSHMRLNKPRRTRVVCHLLCKGAAVSPESQAAKSSLSSWKLSANHKPSFSTVIGLSRFVCETVRDAATKSQKANPSLDAAHLTLNENQTNGHRLAMSTRPRKQSVPRPQKVHAHVLLTKVVQSRCRRRFDPTTPGLAPRLDGLEPSAALRFLPKLSLSHMPPETTTRIVCNLFTTYTSKLPSVLHQTPSWRPNPKEESISGHPSRATPSSRCARGSSRNTRVCTSSQESISTSYKGQYTLENLA